jgi:ribosomal protein L32
MPPPKDPIGRERWLDAHRKPKTPNSVCLHCGVGFFQYPSGIKSGHKKYCSPECKAASDIWKNKIGKSNSKSPNRICKVCGMEFKASPSTIKKGRGIYCSQECRFKDPERVQYNKKDKLPNRICKICGTSFHKFPNAIKKGIGIYCSRECMYSDQELIKKMSLSRMNKHPTEATRKKMSEAGKALKRVKDKNPCWKGGLYALRKLVQNRSEYWEWRKAVFERDNYKDYFSGCSGNLEAHHIISFSTIIEKNNIKTIDEAMRCRELFDVNNGVTMLKTSHRSFHETYG